MTHSPTNAHYWCCPKQKEEVERLRRIEAAVPDALVELGGLDRIVNGEHDICGACEAFVELRDAYLSHLVNDPDFNRMMELSDDPNAGYDAETVRRMLGLARKDGSTERSE